MSYEAIAIANKMIAPKRTDRIIVIGIIAGFSKYFMTLPTHENSSAKKMSPATATYGATKRALTMMKLCFISSYIMSSIIKN